MDTEKTIVVLLLLAILLSVVTLTITLSKDIVVTEGESVTEDVGTASVVLNIVKNPVRTSL